MLRISYVFLFIIIEKVKEVRKYISELRKKHETKEDICRNTKNFLRITEKDYNEKSKRYAKIYFRIT